MNTDDLLDLLAIAAIDRANCAALLESSVGDPAVDAVVAALERSLGTFDEVPVELTTQEELVWLAGFLRFAPTVVDWHREHGIPDDVSRATFADVGRHVAISRRVTGEFGLQTWHWLTHHLTARIYALGRLQFALQRSGEVVPGVIAADDWVLAVHIPESGPLLPALVDESLARAKTFFAEHFGDRPVRHATCSSWMLDPFLLERTTPQSNIGSFVRRFTLTDRFTEGHTDALYFVFRTRDLDRVPSLPRDTSLQRTVLERLDLGESWQVHGGYLSLA